MVDLGRERRWQPLVSAAVLSAGLAVACTPCPTLAECAAVAGETAIVTAVSSASSATLESGETLILTGIVPPEAGPLPDEIWPPRAATRSELDRLIAGKALTIVPGRHRTDRYGNRLGQAFIATPSSADSVWVQGELVAAGLARASALEPDEPCLSELLALEVAARADARGNWGTGVFRDRDAGEFYTLRRLHDTFQTVVGTVEAVEHGRGPPALRLRGSAATESPPHDIAEAGFRVELPDLRDHKSRQTRMESLAGLVGRRVRVRGWLEGQRSAHMVLAGAQLIEILEAPIPGTQAADEKTDPRPR